MEYPQMYQCIECNYEFKYDGKRIDGVLCPKCKGDTTVIPNPDYYCKICRMRRAVRAHGICDRCNGG